MSKTIFVIGATGYLGGVLARHFVEEAHEMFGPLGAMIYSACSRSLDPRARTELGWKPVHGDMLSQVGEPRLRALARPAPEGPEAASTGHAFPGQ